MATRSGDRSPPPAGPLSRQGAARVETLPGFEGRYVEADGYVLGFESFDQAADFTPMYRGLPDDLCQSHHWDYVIEGA